MPEQMAPVADIYNWHQRQRRRKSRRVITARPSPSIPEAYRLPGHGRYLFAFSGNGKHTLARRERDS